MEFIAELGLFFSKALVLVFAFALILMVIAAAGGKAKKAGKGHLEVKSLNDVILALRDELSNNLLSHKEQKQRLKDRHKAEKKAEKDKKHAADKAIKKRVFVINFKGDMKASAVESLREEITAILGQAQETDEVVVKLESPGGLVHSYGLAASQLDRIKKAGIPLTICVDQVAASGGYMMACVANKILAAPFSMIGSIGVVAQLPNFHRLLKKHDVDFEVLTAGEHKRTMTMFGENTDKGREKFLEELLETHTIFKAFVGDHRPNLDMSAIATGEVWLGSKARDLGLVDDVMTSDEYLTSQLDDADLFEVSYIHKKSLQEKVGLAAEESIDGLILRWVKRLYGKNYFS